MPPTLVKTPIKVDATGFAPTSAPTNITTWCDSYVQQPGGLWVPSLVTGPVEAVQSGGSNLYCIYHGPNPPATDDNTWRWWWDYLRGRWPSVLQPRIIAGSSINGQQQDQMGPPTSVVVRQKVFNGSVCHIERVYMLEGTGSVQVQTSASTVTLVANQYTEVQNGGTTLTPPATVGGANPGDMTDPGYFVQQIKADAITRHLPDALPCV